MNDECLICGQPLEYLDHGIETECAICHKREISRTRCVKGHYVCDECHTRGMDVVWGMHGPEHHVMVGAALLTAYKNAGGNIDLEKSLAEIIF